MRWIAWRPVLLAICALAALVQLAGVLDATGVGGAPPWQGSWGANTGASSKPFNLAVTSIDPEGSAARAGLRRGDLIDVARIPSSSVTPFSKGHSMDGLSSFRCAGARCKKS